MLNKEVGHGHEPGEGFSRHRGEPAFFAEEFTLKSKVMLEHVSPEKADSRQSRYYSREKIIRSLMEEEADPLAVLDSLAGEEDRDAFALKEFLWLYAMEKMQKTDQCTSEQWLGAVKYTLPMWENLAAKKRSMQLLHSEVLLINGWGLSYLREKNVARAGEILWKLYASLPEGMYGAGTRSNIFAAVQYNMGICAEANGRQGYARDLYLRALLTARQEGSTRLSEKLSEQAFSEGKKPLLIF